MVVALTPGAGLTPGAPLGVIPEHTDISNWSVSLNGDSSNDRDLSEILGTSGASGFTVPFQGARIDGSRIVQVGTAGQTLTVPENCGRFLINNAASLATLIVNLPTGNDKQDLSIVSLNAVGTLTVNAPGTLTVSNAPTALTGGTGKNFHRNGTAWWAA